MNSVIFKTNSFFDLKTLTTFGVSVKHNSSPIGKFGTGLKYAVAILLREAVDFQLVIAGQRLTFYTKPESIRGQSFELCYMHDGDSEIQLPFTTELGKHWKLWMAYREIFSNTKDEVGVIYTSSDLLPVNDNIGLSTCWIITDERITDIYDNMTEFFLEGENPTSNSTSDLDIIEGESSIVFNRGIRVAQLELPMHNTYNILKDIELTEDRTLKSSYSFDQKIISSVVGSNDPEYITKMLTLDTKFYESGLNYSYSTWMFSQTFVNTMNALCSDPTTKYKVNASVMKHYQEEQKKFQRNQKTKRKTFSISADVPEEFRDSEIMEELTNALANLLDFEEANIEIVETY